MNAPPRNDAAPLAGGAGVKVQNSRPHHTPFFTPTEAMAAGWAPTDRGPTLELCAIVCLMRFPCLRVALRTMPVPVSLLFSDAILASLAAAIVEDIEWAPEPETDSDAIGRRCLAIESYLAVLADREDRRAPGVWTEQDGRYFLRVLMRDAGSPLVATTLRLAAIAVEHGASLRQSQRDVNQAFDLVRGVFAAELDAA